MKPEHVFICFSENEIGLSIYASMDGKTWAMVELQKLRSYESPTVKAYSSCIDVERQKGDYLADIHSRNIKTTVRHSMVNPR